MAGFTWSSSVAVSDPVHAADLTEMRNNVDTLGTAVDIGTFSWSNTPLTGDIIKAIDHQEIRDNLDLAGASNYCHVRWAIHYSGNLSTHENYTRSNHHNLYHLNYHTGYKSDYLVATRVNYYVTYKTNYHYSFYGDYHTVHNNGVNGGHDATYWPAAAITHDVSYYSGDG